MTTLAAHRQRWEARVARMGVTRAPFHVKHRPENLEAITDLQWSVVRPIAQRACAAIRPDVFGRPGFLRVLDYGCGWGRWTERLSEMLPDGSITGVDLTPTLISAAIQQRRSLRTDYKLLNEDGTIPMPVADVIFSWTVLSAIPDPEMLQATLAEWAHVLAPDGLIILVDNTSKVNGKAVRSPDSISRTIEEYQALFHPWCPLSVAGDFHDLGEVNTIFVGRAATL